MYANKLHEAEGPVLPSLTAREPSAEIAPYARAFRDLFSQATERFDVRFWNGEVVPFGKGGAPQFTILIQDKRALLAFDEDSVGEAYVAGYWDIEGDARGAFALRRYLAENKPLGFFTGLLARILFVADQTNNKEAISAHYSLGDDFYLSFLDKKYRIYSHGHFRTEDESLEDAEDHKLEDMFNMLQLKPGMRLLDIGGGWGPVPQYCGERGVKVTSVTLAPDSHRFITRLIEERKLPCEVVLTDFLDFKPAEPFDAIVIYGVIEHIPQYRRFCEQVWKVLKPNGLMYLDASASRFKYDMNAMTKKYVWPTTTAYLSTHDLIAELNYGGFDLLELKNESRDYELTMLHWSRRFEAAKDFIVSRWGEKLYRIFRLYLWGGNICFEHDRLQAYRMLIRRRAERIPPPSLVQRGMFALWSSR